MKSRRTTLPDWLLWIAITLFVAFLAIMALMGASKDAAKVFIWTTIGASAVLGVTMPTFWRFRRQPRFWVVSLAILAVHTAACVILLPMAIQMPIVVFTFVILPIESALVFLAFQRALGREDMAHGRERQVKR